MLTAYDRDRTLLNTLRAEREAADERARRARLAEAQRWEEYLFTALDQLTARLQRSRPVGRDRHQPPDDIRRGRVA